MVIGGQTFVGQFEEEHIFIPVAVLEVVEAEVALVEVGHGEGRQQEHEHEPGEAEDEVGDLKVGLALWVLEVVELDAGRPDDGDELVLPDLVPEVENSLTGPNEEK